MDVVKPFAPLLAAAVVLTGRGGVGDGANLGEPMVTDVTTTRFALATDDGVVFSDAYALRESAGQIDEVGQPVPYQPHALAVIIAPGSADPSLGAMAWPGPALPGQDVDLEGTTCTVVDGADLAPVLEVAGQARLKTPWSDGGRTWDLRFRPLLPDEDSCEDLATPAGS